MGLGGQSHETVAEPWGKKPGTHFAGGRVGPRNGLNGCRKVTHTWVRIQHLLARSESLYQLRCPGPLCAVTVTWTERVIRKSFVHLQPFGFLILGASWEMLFSFCIANLKLNVSVKLVLINIDAVLLLAHFMLTWNIMLPEWSVCTSLTQLYLMLYTYICI
jgi:hypothetical protein